MANQNKPQKKTSGGTLSGAIGFYTIVLMAALFMLFTLHLFLIFFLTRRNLTNLTNLTTPSPVFSVLFAIPYSLLISGFGVCLLLSLWLKNRSTAIIVTVVLVLLWVAGLVRYVVGEDLFSRILVILLAMGVLVLPVFWFLRPLEGPFTGMLTFGWILLWFLLFISTREDLIRTLLFLPVVDYSNPDLLLPKKEYLAGTMLFLSLVTSGAVFLGGLYIASSFLLPLPDKRHRGRIFNFLQDFIMGINFPVYVVVDELYEEDKIENRVPGNPFSEFTDSPGFVITDCDHAVAISSGTKFKGVHGPGITFIRFGDQVVQTIDLRPQLRAFPVDVLTKDGIKIKVLAFTPCKIDARGRKPALGEPLPYNKSAAFKAIHAQRTEHEANQTKQRTWYDLPRMIAERTLQNIISEYNFDDLYGPYQPGGVPLRKIIAGRFYKQVAAELEPLGVRLVGGGISDLQPADPQVYVKRVHSWQAEWTRKITLKQAEGQAEWLRIVEHARAEAQTDLIMSMGRQLEELSTMRTEFRPEKVLEQVVIILDQLTGQSALRGALPEETLRGIMYIREAFTE